MSIRVLFLSILCLPLLGRAEATGWTPERLMQQLAGSGRHQAHFSETRELALLQSTLTTQGTLSFTAPDRLTKAYDPPQGQRFVIVGNRLTIRNGDGEEQVVLLDNSPQLLAYIASLRAVLAGDLQTLRHYFQLELHGTSDTWRLILTPADSPLAGQIRQIEVEGVRGEISQFLVIEQGGDRTLTRLVDTDEK